MLILRTKPWGTEFIMVVQLFIYALIPNNMVMYFLQVGYHPWNYLLENVWGFSFEAF